MKYRQALPSPTMKIQFQQAVNSMKTFMIPSIALPAQQLEQLLQTVVRIVFCQLSQHMVQRFITPGIGLVKIPPPAGLAETHSKLHRQIADVVIPSF